MSGHDAGHRQAVAEAGSGGLGHLVERTDRLVREAELSQREDADVRADITAAAERRETYDEYVTSRDQAIAEAGMTPFERLLSQQGRSADQSEDGWW